MNVVIERLGGDPRPYATPVVLDAFKEPGFHFAPQAGITISKNDVVIPPDKEKILEGYEAQVGEIQDQYDMGLITQEERKEAVVDKDRRHRRGRRGDAAQPRRAQPGVHDGQLDDCSSRSASYNNAGLMANPKGEIIERPIRANFMEGLTVLEYFISTHGARKGLADTALRTTGLRATATRRFRDGAGRDRARRGLRHQGAHRDAGAERGRPATAGSRAASRRSRSRPSAAGRSARRAS